MVSNLGEWFMHDIQEVCLLYDVYVNSQPFPIICDRYLLRHIVELGCQQDKDRQWNAENNVPVYYQTHIGFIIYATSLLFGQTVCMKYNFKCIW